MRVTRHSSLITRIPGKHVIPSGHLCPQGRRNRRFAAPHGVLSVARRFNPNRAFLIADSLRPAGAAGFGPPQLQLQRQPAMDV
jgi:hypothetical protein